MDDSVAGVVLAAGSGSRLVPLTRLRPKALCPVGTVPLVDHALARLAAGGIASTPDRVAVNLHHGADQLDAHLPTWVHRSVEAPVALGTAGALGRLRPWLAGRDVLVTNADAWLPGPIDLTGLVADWDRERVRLLCVVDGERGDFGDRRYCGIALLPAALVAHLEAEPSGLYEVMWREQAAKGRLDLVLHPGTFIDCATVTDYWRANMDWSSGQNVIDPTAEVSNQATLARSVIWDESKVEKGEILVDAIRTESQTILIR